MHTPYQGGGVGSVTPTAGGSGHQAGKGAEGSSELMSTSSDSTWSVSHAVLCLLLKHSITCIFPSGELLECPLLQPCQTMWPLPTGVILAVSICTMRRVSLCVFFVQDVFGFLLLCLRMASFVTQQHATHACLAHFTFSLPPVNTRIQSALCVFWRRWLCVTHFLLASPAFKKQTIAACRAPPSPLPVC